jgi:adenylate cyclase
MPVPSFGWYLLITQTRDSFYAATNQILQQSVIILAAAAVFSLLLLLLFSGYLTGPLRRVVGAMRGIIASRDLSQRVSLLYRDETGELGHTFNIMTGELQSAYEQIKGYALETAIARKRERKIRSIFQRYVPQEIIDTFFSNPESMLVGEDRVLAILFSDIRGFTTISEGMRPDQMVEALNSYFGLMVDVITSHSGIVDKYIGDAIMAFYGAPVRHGDDAYRAVLSAFDMIDALGQFNAGQKEKGRPPFSIGIGINYGVATVGNIGSDKKMDYTVIGDMVNLASRLEGLTKVYREPLIFSESVCRAVEGKFPCRHLDRVAVKGKKRWVNIFTARRALTPAEQEAWGLHQLGLDLFYGREFGKAGSCFSQALRYLPQDRLSRSFLGRCALYSKSPPPPAWSGVVTIKEK